MRHDHVLNGSFPRSRVSEHRTMLALVVPVLFFLLVPCRCFVVAFILMRSHRTHSHVCFQCFCMCHLAHPCASKTRRRTTDRILHSPWTNHERMNQNHDIYLTERDGKFTRMQCFWINLKSAQDKGSAFWQTRSNASILDNSVPADCLDKVVHTKSEEVRYRKIHLSSRPPPKSYPPECLASSTRRARSTWR